MAYAAVSSAGVSSCSRSSGAAFSARSSFRIEATRISQTRCFVSVFLLSYSRLRSSPSTWTCAPFVSVLANSERLPKTTQRCHSVCEMYLPSFLQEDLVASESVVTLKSALLVRASALLPRKPMRVTLFWYMRVSPFLEFARCCSGHTGRSLASGPGSQVPKVCFLGGPETPKGRRMRSRRPSAAGRRKGPEAVTEQETGYITADTLQIKVLIRTLAAEVHRNCSPIRAGMSTVRRAQFATAVARRKALVRLLREAQRQVGKASRISSMKGHE